MMIRAVTLAAILTAVAARATPAFGTETADALAVVKQYTEHFNQGEMKVADALCTDHAVIIEVRIGMKVHPCLLRGSEGKISGGVYQIGIPRAEPVTEAGMAINAAMGSAEAINFQPTGHGKAAITGDFVLIAKEVNPVLRALREHGIEVTALHNHMLDDEPRLFFMHFWANGDLSKLREGLHAALGNVAVAKG